MIVHVGPGTSTRLIFTETEGLGVTVRVVTTVGPGTGTRETSTTVRGSGVRVRQTVTAGRGSPPRFGVAVTVTTEGIGEGLRATLAGSDGAVVRPTHPASTTAQRAPESPRASNHARGRRVVSYPARFTSGGGSNSVVRSSAVEVIGSKVSTWSGSRSGSPSGNP